MKARASCHFTSRSGPISDHSDCGPIERKRSVMSRCRLMTATAVFAVSLVAAGSAAAFDCIRVSASVRGLEQSTTSGNWFAFDLSSVEGVQRAFAALEDPPPTVGQAQCFVERYAATGQPRSFAVGIGVGGPRGVVAFRNAKTMGDGKGVDHLEGSGIPAAFLAAVEACGIEVTD